MRINIVYRNLFVLFAFSLLWRSSINNSADAGRQLIGREIDAEARRFVEISAEDLEDKIRSGLLVQLLGNLSDNIISLQHSKVSDRM